MSNSGPVYDGLSRTSTNPAIVQPGMKVAKNLAKNEPGTLTPMFTKGVSSFLVRTNRYGNFGSLAISATGAAIVDIS